MLLFHREDWRDIRPSFRRGRSVFFRDKVRRVNYESGLTSEYLDFMETADWLDRNYPGWQIKME
jgi:hypothetical protein